MTLQESSPPDFPKEPRPPWQQEALQAFSASYSKASIGIKF